MLVRLAITVAATLPGFAQAAFAGPPAYTIVDLGVIDPGDFGSQAFRISSGGVVTGRSIGASNQAFSWTEGERLVALPNLASRPFGVGNGANDAGAIVGTGSTTVFGSSPLPLIWRDGAVSLLPLPAGETIGRATDINATGTVVGSVDGGSVQQAAVFTTESAFVVATPALDGSTMVAAFSVNDAGLAVGIGKDPANAARNVGFVYDTVGDVAFEVGALPGRNGAIAFDVSHAGHVVGSSMLNQGSGTPFLWTEADGMIEVPLPDGTSQGSARGVNSRGWVVGTASSAFAVPFLFDGTTTYRLADLLPAGSPWDLDMNTSSSAMSISEDGVIVGTGVVDGETRAYAMIPVAAVCPGDADGDGVVGFTDLLALLAAWGKAPGSPSDLDGDGDVDFEDLVGLLANWGPCG